MKPVRAAAVLCVLVFAACGPDATLNQVAVGLSTASNVSRAAALALDGMKASTACTTVTTACAAYPCDGAVTVTLGAGCPLFIGGEATGTVTVSGHWTSVDKASLSTEFAGVKASGAKNEVAVAKVTTISVERASTTITVKYTGTNAVTRANVDRAAAANTEDWTVAVNTKGTTDPADDSISVTASSVAASAGLGNSAKVVSMHDVAVDPSCTLNPTAGTADVTEVQGVIPKITNVKFHSGCDGKAEVNGVAQALVYYP